MTFLFGRIWIGTLLSGGGGSLIWRYWGLRESSLAIDIHFASNLVDTLLRVFNHFYRLFPFFFKSCFCSLDLLSFNVDPPVNGLLFSLISSRTALVLLEQALDVFPFAAFFKLEHFLLELDQFGVFTVSHDGSQLLLRVLLERVPIKHATARLTSIVKIIVVQCLVLILILIQEVHIVVLGGLIRIITSFISLRIISISAIFVPNIVSGCLVLDKIGFLCQIFRTTWFYGHLDISDVKIGAFLRSDVRGRVWSMLHIDFSLAWKRCQLWLDFILVKKNLMVSYVLKWILISILISANSHRMWMILFYHNLLQNRIAVDPTDAIQHATL